VVYCDKSAVVAMRCAVCRHSMFSVPKSPAWLPTKELKVEELSRPGERAGKLNMAANFDFSVNYSRLSLVSGNVAEYHSGAPRCVGSHR
jgi:hypothetical protein